MLIESSVSLIGKGKTTTQDIIKHVVSTVIYACTSQIDEKKNDPIKQRQADENRAEYKQKSIECRVPMAKNCVIAAVHTENAIT